MSATPTTPIRVHVDRTNPGQFFACCGLLELAHRVWGEAEGWFESQAFVVRCSHHSTADTSLGALLAAVSAAPLQQIDPTDDTASAIEIGVRPPLRIDWWCRSSSPLKVWAGSMRGARIARAMQAALARPDLHDEHLLDFGMVVYDPLEPDKKVEPFYFDARRGANARPIDIGFSSDAIQMTSAAYPAVEFLCLVGLQRFQPRPTELRRVFEYFTWSCPLQPTLAAVAACGVLRLGEWEGFRFESAFRTDQRKHKAFRPAVAVTRSCS